MAVASKFDAYCRAAAHEVEVYHAVALGNIYARFAGGTSARFRSGVGVVGKLDVRICRPGMASILNDLLPSLPERLFNLRGTGG